MTPLTPELASSSPVPDFEASLIPPPPWTPGVTRGFLQRWWPLAPGKLGPGRPYRYVAELHLPVERHAAVGGLIYTHSYTHIQRQRYTERQSYTLTEREGEMERQREGGDGGERETQR